MNEREVGGPASHSRNTDQDVDKALWLLSKQAEALSAVRELADRMRPQELTCRCWQTNWEPPGHSGQRPDVRYAQRDNVTQPSAPQGQAGVFKAALFSQPQNRHHSNVLASQGTDCGASSSGRKDGLPMAQSDAFHRPRGHTLYSPAQGRFSKTKRGDGGRAVLIARAEGWGRRRPPPLESKNYLVTVGPWPH